MDEETFSFLKENGLIKEDHKRKFENGKLYAKDENGKWILIEEFPEYKKGIPMTKVGDFLRRIEE